MRYLAGLILFLHFLLSAAFAAEVPWQELKSEHFIVYFAQDEKFAQDALDKAEVYYARIAQELNYPRYSEFWTWDKRVKIYIYPDLNSFLKATGQPSWSRGMADYKKKEIDSYAWSSGFLESLLPHEMAHLIFRDFVGFKSELPLWLDEGVAQWAEEEKRQEAKKAAKELFEKDSLLSIEDMMKADVRNVKDTDKIYFRSSSTKDGKKGTLLLSGNSLVNIYYTQSVSLVSFLIEKYGQDSFTSFCRQLRDGANLEDALSYAYPNHIQTLSELEEKWRQYVAASN